MGGSNSRELDHLEDSAVYLSARHEEEGEHSQELIPPDLLVASYMEHYIDFLSLVQRQLTSQKYDFTGQLENFERKDIRVFESCATQLPNSVVNATLNEMCKQGHLRSIDLQIRFEIKANIPLVVQSHLKSLLRLNSPPQTLTIVAHENKFKTSWLCADWTIVVPLEAHEIWNATTSDGDFVMNFVGAPFPDHQNLCGCNNMPARLATTHAAEDCSVCLAPLSTGAVVMLPCQHVLHEHCRQQLMQKSTPPTLCPLCRRTI